MGSISIFQQDQFDTYQPQVFIETGTWKGDGLLSIIQRFNLAEYHSIELSPLHFSAARDRFAEYPNVFIHQGHTLDILPELLKRLSSYTSILFWLDAHLPEITDEAFGDRSQEVAFPLEKELQIIKETRPTQADVIVADDLRIYEDGPFTIGCAPEVYQSKTRGISFIENLFPDRIITKSFESEGYIFILPK